MPADRSLFRGAVGGIGSYHASVDEVRICCARAEETRAEIEVELAAEAFLDCRDAAMAHQLAREYMARHELDQSNTASI